MTEPDFPPNRLLDGPVYDAEAFAAIDGPPGVPIHVSDALPPDALLIIAGADPNDPTAPPIQRRAFLATGLGA
jgi:hypothetical protein